MTDTNLTTEEKAFNSGDGGDQPLHEISGMTEGYLADGTTRVTVAEADKNNEQTRDGTGAIAISYTDSSNKAHYEVINFSEKDRAALQGVGFEDMDWRDDGTPGGTYYFVDEGGGKEFDKNGTRVHDYKAPTVYTAKLVTNQDGTHEMQLTGSPITAVVPEAEWISPWTGSPNPQLKANGAEGMAVDQAGNIYMGMQSGNIYKGTLEDDGSYTWGQSPMIETGYNDLSAMDFDSKGNLVVGFGSNSWGQTGTTTGDNRNHVITYQPVPDTDYNNQVLQDAAAGAGWGGPMPDLSLSMKTDWQPISNTKVEGLYDLEGLYQDDQGHMIAASDNDSKAENITNVVAVPDNTTIH